MTVVEVEVGFQDGQLEWDWVRVKIRFGDRDRIRFGDLVWGQWSGFGIDVGSGRVSILGSGLDFGIGVWFRCRDQVSKQGLGSGFWTRVGFGFRDGNRVGFWFKDGVWGRVSVPEVRVGFRDKDRGWISGHDSGFRYQGLGLGFWMWSGSGFKIGSGFGTGVGYKPRPLVPKPDPNF